MTKIIGNNDSPGGRNETYKIGNRPAVKLKEAVTEIKQDKHPGAHVYERN